MEQQGAPAPASFFTTWEPPPFTPKPADAELAKRMDKLIEYCVKNGPQFEAMVKVKQKDDPAYEFLFGGPHHAYYRWALYCQVYNLNVDQPLNSHPQDGVPQSSGGFSAASQQGEMMGAPFSNFGMPQQESAIASLPTEISTGFNQVMDALNPTKDSITAGRNWFMACAAHCAGMSELMAERGMMYLSQGPTLAERQLNLVYLANDILFQAQRQRPSPDDWTDPISLALRGPLTVVISATMLNSGGNPQMKERLEGLLQFWEAKSVFDPATIGAMKQAMTSPDPKTAANLLPPQSQLVAPQQQQQQQQQQHPQPMDQMPQPPAQGAYAGMSQQQGWDSQQGAGMQPQQQSMQMQQQQQMQMPQQMQHPQGGGGMWNAPSQQMGMNQFGQPPMQQAGGFDQMQQQQQPQQPMQSGFSGPPTQMGGMDQPGSAQGPPQALGGASTGDAFFPPGLIPALAKNANGERFGAYSPISPLDIPPQVPPPGAMTDYLRTRLDRFYEDLRDGGRQRHIDRDRELAQMEQERLTRLRENREEGKTGGGGVNPETGTYADGSVPGGKGGGSMYAGLGSGGDHHEQTGGLGMPRSGDPAEDFDEYRRKQADQYHTRRGGGNVGL